MLRWMVRLRARNRYWCTILLILGVIAAALLLSFSPRLAPMEQRLSGRWTVQTLWGNDALEFHSNRRFTYHSNPNQRIPPYSGWWSVENGRLVMRFRGAEATGLMTRIERPVQDWLGTELAEDRISRRRIVWVDDSTVTLISDEGSQSMLRRVQ